MKKALITVAVIISIGLNIGLIVGLFIAREKIRELKSKLAITRSVVDSVENSKQRSFINTYPDTIIVDKTAILVADSSVTQSLNVIIGKLEDLPYNKVVPLDEFVDYLEAQTNFNNLVAETLIKKP